jgi:two-component system cell cycle sensor histidine kinase/response regulator CckA
MTLTRKKASLNSVFTEHNWKQYTGCDMYAPSRRVGSQSLGTGQHYAAVVFDQSVDALVVMDDRGIIRDWNPRAEEVFGWSHQEIVGRTVAETIVPERFRQAHRHGLAQQMETGESLVDGKTMELIGLHHDGHEFPLRLTIWRSIVGGHGLFVGMVRDTFETDAPATSLQPQLLQGAQLAELLLESAGEGTYGVDLEGRFTFANRAAERMLGWTRAELLGRDMHALVHHSHPDGSPHLPADCPMTRAMERGETVRIDDDVLWTKSGEALPVLYSASPVFSSGEVAGAVVTFTDIRRRQVAEQDLKTSKASNLAMAEDYRLLFQSHPEPMWVYDIQNLGFLDVNIAAIDKYGYSREEFLAMTIRDIRPPGDVEDPTVQIEASGSIDESAPDKAGPWRHQRKDGTRIDVEIASHPIRFAHHDARVVMARDVTGRRRLEHHLERAERLDSIGKLAGGVAHDFNNLLSVIINYAGFVREAVPPETSGPQNEVWRSVDDDVRQIERAAAQATSLTQQLLAFARKEPIQPEVLNVNDVVRDLEQFLRRTFVEQIELVTTLTDDPWPVLMDPGKLEQVLMNLSINARDSMSGGGTLTIATENFDVVAEQIDPLPDLVPGHYLRITVRDTGSGMTEAVVHRAFEPFFTTKKAGEGTGLGLATAYGIVKQAGGEIHVESTPAVGTTFDILIPAHFDPSPEPLST